MYEERLMCLIRNCGVSNAELIRLFHRYIMRKIIKIRMIFSDIYELFQTLCYVQQNLRYNPYVSNMMYTMHENVSIVMIKSKIALFYTEILQQLLCNH